MKFFNKKNNKLIIEYGKQFFYTPKLEPAKNFIPNWYKNIMPVDTKNIKQLPARLNVKSCVPFLDSFMSGYMIILPMDIAVQKDPITKEPVITWSVKEYSPVGVRDEWSTPNMEAPAGHERSHFVWSTQTSIKLPKGYSCLYTHPLNRYDLPFITLSGIIDGDSMVARGNIPFYIRKDFEGIIKKGTPIIQVIPFKRENWVSLENKELESLSIKTQEDEVLTTFNWYKKNNWKKKNYD